MTQLIHIYIKWQLNRQRKNDQIQETITIILFINMQSTFYIYFIFKLKIIKDYLDPCGSNILCKIIAFSIYVIIVCFTEVLK